MPIMPVKLGPAGVPLSCKGRTIVEGMDDIISLGLETMEVQTVRMVAPNHFEQYWQAGVLANKTEFEMNIHGPYYSELLGNRVERGRSLAKIESTLQAARTINARHITLHAGHYGGMSPVPQQMNRSQMSLQVSLTGLQKSGMTTKMNSPCSRGSRMEPLRRLVLKPQAVRSYGAA